MKILAKIYKKGIWLYKDAFYFGYVVGDCMEILPVFKTGEWRILYRIATPTNCEGFLYVDLIQKGD